MLQFLHQLFNMSTLLLDDALLKCVVTEVVLLSVVNFKTLIFHNVVQRPMHLTCSGIFSSSTITNFILILTVK